MNAGANASATSVDNNRHAYWAIIDHLRTWNRFDRPVRLQIEADGGLTAYTASAIAIEYGLMQSLPWKGGFDRFRRIADIVNENAPPSAPGASLVDRCAIALRIAEKLQAKFTLPAAPCSAASKLYWFIRPEEWTMFDRHAFNALGMKSEGRKTDMARFYALLEKAGFRDCGRRLDVAAASHGVEIDGNRILDKMLMLQGSAAVLRNRKFGENVRDECRRYDGLPDSVTIEAVRDLETIAGAWR